MYTNVETSVKFVCFYNFWQFTNYRTVANEENVCVICKNQYVYRCSRCHRRIFDEKKTTGLLFGTKREDTAVSLLLKIKNVFSLLAKSCDCFRHYLSSALTERHFFSQNSYEKRTSDTNMDNPEVDDNISKNKEILAYIVTIEASLEEECDKSDDLVAVSVPSSPRRENEECESLKAKSTSSLKPKLSRKLMRPFLRKSKSKNLDSHTKPTPKEDNHENPFISDVGTNTEIDCKSDQSRSFFRKLLSKQPRENIRVRNKDVDVKTENVINLIDEEVRHRHELKKTRDDDDAITAAAYLRVGSHNANNVYGLRNVFNFMKELRESETHLIHILSKYVRDENLQKQLIDAVSDCSKIRLEAERRSQILANEMWQHQIDIHRSQEKALRGSLNQIIKQNRQLQEDYENLKRKSEILIQSSKLNLSSSESVDVVNGNTEKLQQKLSATTNHVGLLEDEIQTLQKDNFSLREQLHEFSSQLEEYKTKLQRACNEHSLEKTVLEKTVEEIQKKIKDGEEAAQVLLADLDSLKRQTSLIPFSISTNWNKLKDCGISDLSDLIHTCRAFINELSRELIATNSQLKLKDKDIESVRDNNKRLQESLQKSSTELDKIYKKVETCSVYEHEKENYKEKNVELEKTVQDLKKQLEMLQQQYDEVKKERDAVNKEIKMKTVYVEEKDSVLCSYKSESEALKAQIDGLNQVLKATGAGDVARDLSNMQEKLSTLQSQYYQVLAQKSYLSEQLNSCKSERDALMQYQQTYHQHFEALQGDFESLNKENKILKDRLQAERTTIVALQNEKARHLDEKNVLKSIYQHYKNESAKVQKLEATIAEMNQEKSRLTIIAEYNKQLGEKLKSEVEQRDQTISKLQNNVQVLNNIQIEDTKDKVALCAELTEVCTIKDKLNNSLSLEMQKNVYLDDVKKELEKAKNLQLKAFEDIQKAERVALKELLKDFKQVVSQRDHLSMVYDESSKRVIELQKIVTNLQRTHKETMCKLKEKESKISDFEEQLKKKDCALEVTLKKAETESASYENTLENLYKYTDQMKKEKENLENSVQYLQNNTQKLHNDLNEARKKEKEVKDELSKISVTNEELQKTLSERNSLLEETVRENEELRNEIRSLNESKITVINGFESTVGDFMKNQQMLQGELCKSKQREDECTKRITTLLQAIDGKENQINFLSNKLYDMHQEKLKLMKSLQTIEQQLSLVSDAYRTHAKLQDDLIELEKHHAICIQQIKSLSNEFDVVQNKISKSLKEHNKESQLYEKQLSEIVYSYNMHKKNINETLQMIVNKINDIMADYEDDKMEHEKLSNAHKLLAAKLMNALKMLVDEKVTRQNAESKFFEVHQKYNVAKAENVSLKQSVELLETELCELRKITGDLRNDKNYIQEALTDVQRAHKESVSKCELLEQELVVAKKICSDLTQRQEDEKSAISKGLVLKQADSEDRISRLKEELNDSHNMIMQLRKEISKLQQEITTLEFQKCELNLRLHETHGKYLTEVNLHKELRKTHQQVLSTLLEYKDKGLICKHVYEEIFFKAKTDTLNLYRKSECSLRSNDSKFSFSKERPNSSCSFSSN